MNVLEKILEEIDKRKDYRERLVKYEERMGTITDVIRNKGAIEELGIIEKIIRSHMDDDTDDWIPAEDTDRTPKGEDYILVSFSNFSLADIARYEEDEEGGIYYPRDEDKPYKEYGFFVNAWRPLQNHIDQRRLELKGG